MPMLRRGMQFSGSVRSVVAVMMGFIVMMIVVIGLTLVMVKTIGIRVGHPTPGYLTYNAIAALFAAFVGGLTTGTIAAERRVRHGYLLAMVMLLMAALSYVHYQGGQPPWYQAMMVVLPPVMAVLGAKFAQISYLASVKAGRSGRRV